MAACYNIVVGVLGMRLASISFPVTAFLGSVSEYAENVYVDTQAKIDDDGILI